MAYTMWKMDKFLDMNGLNGRDVQYRNFHLLTTRVYAITIMIEAIFIYKVIATTTMTIKILRKNVLDEGENEKSKKRERERNDKM